MSKFDRTPSLTHRINFGLILGSVILLLLVVGGATGLVLNSKIQDSRSQAAAKRIAQISVSEPRVRADGYRIQQVGIDASQLKAGSTVTSFKSVLYVPRISVIQEISPDSVVSSDTDTTYITADLGENNRTHTSPPNPGNPNGVKKLCRSDKDCMDGSVCYQPPTPNCSPGKPCSVQAPHCRPQVKPTAVPSEVPTPDLLAASKDSSIRVWGVNNFREVKDLAVSVETTPEMYLIIVSGSTDRNNSAIQTAFTKNVPILTVVLHDEALRWSQVTLKGATIRGFVPGIPTELELTGGDDPIPSVVPSSVPVISCVSDKECGEGKYCYQPMPPCQPGTPCTAMMRPQGYCQQLTTCGGIQGAKCAPGYSCRLTAKHSDATGFCYPDPTVKPRPINTCFSNEDCKAGQKCIQPPVPTCKPGAACIEMMPARKCVSLPD